MELEDISHAFSLSIGFLAVSIRSIFTSFLLFIPYLQRFVLFSLNFVNYGFRILWRLTSAALAIIGFIVYLIFEPFNLIIKIIDFNTRQFLNFWVSLLFSTTIEKILNFENGVAHFKIFVEWVRFFNAMCITGLILGIITYYLFVRTIYWMTKIEKKTSKRIEQLTGGKINVTGIQDSPIKYGVRSKKDDQLSLLNDYLNRYPLDPVEGLDQHFQNNENEIKGPRAQDILEQSSSFESSSYNDDPIETSNAKPFLFPTEDQEEDDYNYESLHSLSNSTINTFNRAPVSLASPSGSPVTKAFRSRVSSENTFRSRANEEENLRSPHDETNSSTVTSSIFSTGTVNRVPMTPITVIEEEDEKSD